MSVLLLILMPGLRILQNPVMRAGLLLTITSLLMAAAASAEAPRNEPTRFRRYNIEDGLSQSSITSIVQDRKGFIWIGTFDGLNRFDGTTFDVFRHNPSDPHSIRSNWITGLFIDSAGVLWVRTQDGLDRYHRPSESFERVEHGRDLKPFLPSNGAGSSVIWMKGSSIVARDPATGSLPAPPPEPRKFTEIGLPVYALAEDGAGHLWIAGGTTLSKVNLATLSLEESHEIGQRDVITLLPSRRLPGVVWLGCADALLRFRNGKTEPVAPATITSLIEDSLGYLWIGSQEYLGRMRLDDTPTVIERIRHRPNDPASLSHNIVNVLAQDGNGSLWVGTYNGISHYDREIPPFRSSGTRPIIPAASVTISLSRSPKTCRGTSGSGRSVRASQSCAAAERPPGRSHTCGMTPAIRTASWATT